MMGVSETKHTFCTVFKAFFLSKLHFHCNDNKTHRLVILSLLPAGSAVFQKVTIFFDTMKIQQNYHRKIWRTEKALKTVQKG